MNQFKITAQDYILAQILEHLEHGIMGQAIAREWDYELRQNVIYFTLKEGGVVKLDDLFWLGYLTLN